MKVRIFREKKGKYEKELSGIVVVEDGLRGYIYILEEFGEYFAVLWTEWRRGIWPVRFTLLRHSDEGSHGLSSGKEIALTNNAVLVIMCRPIFQGMRLNGENDP